MWQHKDEAKQEAARGGRVELQEGLRGKRDVTGDGNLHMAAGRAFPAEVQSERAHEWRRRLGEARQPCAADADHGRGPRALGQAVEAGPGLTTASHGERKVAMMEDGGGYKTTKRTLDAARLGEHSG